MIWLHYIEQEIEYSKLLSPEQSVGFKAPDGILEDKSYLNWTRRRQTKK